MFQQAGGKVIQVSVQNSPALSSDEQIARLTESVSGWVSQEGFDYLALLDNQVAEAARVASLARTKVESNALQFNLRQAREGCDNAYTHEAARLYKIINSPQHAEEMGILQTLTTARSCQLSALREVLHKLVKDDQDSQTGVSISTTEGVLV
jgi:hypothetical protein